MVRAIIFIQEDQKLLLTEEDRATGKNNRVEYIFFVSVFPDKSQNPEKNVGILTFLWNNNNNNNNSELLNLFGPKPLL